MKTIPEAVLAALEHVRQFHPSVDRVVFWDEDGWLFYDDRCEVPDEWSREIDTGILELAMDAAYEDGGLPQAYQLPRED